MDDDNDSSRLVEQPKAHGDAKGDEEEVRRGSSSGFNDRRGSVSSIATLKLGNVRSNENDDGGEDDTSGEDSKDESLNAKSRRQGTLLPRSHLKQNVTGFVAVQSVPLPDNDNDSSSSFSGISGSGSGSSGKSNDGNEGKRRSVARRRSSRNSTTDVEIMYNSLRFTRNAGSEAIMFSDDDDQSNSFYSSSDMDMEVMDLRPGGGRRGSAMTIGLDSSLVSLPGTAAGVTGMLSAGLDLDDSEDGDEGTEAEGGVDRGVGLGESIGEAGAAAALFRVDKVKVMASSIYKVASKRGKSADGPNNDNDKEAINNNSDKDKDKDKDNTSRLASYGSRSPSGLDLESRESRSKYDPPKHWDSMHVTDDDDGGSDDDRSESSSSTNSGRSAQKNRATDKASLARRLYVRRCARAVAFFALLAAISGTAIYLEDKEDFDKAFDVFPYNALGKMFRGESGGRGSERSGEKRRLFTGGDADVVDMIPIPIEPFGGRNGRNDDGNYLPRGEESRRMQALGDHGRTARKQARFHRRMANRAERRLVEQDLAERRRRATFQGPEEGDYYAQENYFLQGGGRRFIVPGDDEGEGWMDRQRVIRREIPQDQMYVPEGRRALAQEEENVGYQRDRALLQQQQHQQQQAPGRAWDTSHQHPQDVWNSNNYP